MTASELFLFVSHVSEDRTAAMQVVDELERRGVRCWIAPRDIRAGRPFDEEIADAIDGCRAVLLIFSDRCNDSPYIRREITVAGDANKVVIPFRIEDAQPKRGLRVRLADLHWIDAFVAREQAIDEAIRAKVQAQAVDEVIQTLGPTGLALTSSPSTPSVTSSNGDSAYAPPIHDQRDKGQWRPSRRAAMMMGAGAAALAGIGGMAIWLGLSDDRHRPIPPSPAPTESSWPGLIRTFSGHSAAISSVAFSPDGRAALSGSSKEFKLWDIASGNTIRTFPGDSQFVFSIAFSSDGRSALSGGMDKMVKLWDIATGKLIRVFSGHSDRIFSVAFSPDGRSALSGADDKTLKLWDIATGNLIRTFSGHSDGVLAVAFAPDGHMALSGSADETLKLWDVATGNALRTFAGSSSRVRSVAFSPDGGSALSGSGEKTPRLWDIATGNLLRTFSGHLDRALAVALSPDGHSALSGSYDKTLKLWNVATGTALRTLVGHSGIVGSVAFSPDGRMALSGSDDKTLKLWDLMLP